MGKVIEMEPLQKKLIGALIGIARAADGSEHLITPAVTDVLIRGLSSIQADEHTLNLLIQEVEKVKFSMVPNCFSCANPCGRTSAYDLDALRHAAPAVRTCKYNLLTKICQLAASKKDTIPVQIYYQALTVIGLDDYTAEDIQPILALVEDYLR